jgi:ribosomal protein L37E
MPFASRWLFHTRDTKITTMTDLDLHIRCQRCGAEMEMRDPAPGMPWRPDQFWVCPRCGRHFWSTYPAPSTAKPKPAAEPVT